MSEDKQRDFLAAGFEPRHLLEIIAVVAASTITNHTSSVMQSPLDGMIVEHVWRAKGG